MARSRKTAGGRTKRPSMGPDLTGKILDRLPVLICELTPQTRINYVNDSIFKITGYRPSEIIGKYCSDIFFGGRHRSEVDDLLKTLRRKDIHDHEVDIRDKSGKKISLSWNSANVYDSKGALKKIILIGKDVSERKRAGEKLWKSEELYRVLIENQGEGFSIVDRDEKFMYANPASEEIFGVGPKGLVGRTLEEFMTKEQFKRIREQTEKRKTGERGNYECEITRPDGKKKFLLVTATPWLNDKGEFEGAAGVFRDITDRKMTEKELEVSEEKYRTILESMSDGVHIIDRDWNIILFNDIFKKWCEELGVKSDVMGKNVLKAFPFLPELVRKEYEKTFESGKPVVSNEHLLLCGVKIYTETRKIPILKDGTVTHVLTTVRNISEKHYAAEKLNKIEKEKNLILDTLAELVVYQDKDHNVLWVNRAAANSVGLKPEELAGRKCYEIWHGRGYVCEDCPVHKAVLSGTPHEGEVRSPDGKAWCIKGYPVLNRNNEVEAVVEITLDITELRKAQKERDTLSRRSRGSKDLQ